MKIMFLSGCFMAGCALSAFLDDPGSFPKIATAFADGLSGGHEMDINDMDELIEKLARQLEDQAEAETQYAADLHQMLEDNRR